MKKWSHALHRQDLPVHKYHPTQIFPSAPLRMRRPFKMWLVNSHNLPNGLCPLSPKACRAWFERGPKGKYSESAHITGESTPLSVLLLFLVEHITLLVVEINQKYQEHLHLFDDGHSPQTDVTKGKCLRFWLWRYSWDIQFKADCGANGRNLVVHYGQMIVRSICYHILQFLHFTDSSRNGIDSHDRIWKLRHLFEILQTNFKNLTTLANIWQ